MSIDTLHIPRIDTATGRVIDTLATPFEQAEKFCAAMHAKFGEHEHFQIDPGGRKYIRIVQFSTKYSQTPQRSVHAFVDATTGDLLKAAGWNAPAKGARGNIMDDEVLAKIVEGADQFGGYLYKR